jgi:hypothetical protein
MFDADFGKTREDTHLQATGSSLHRNYILQHGPVRAFERTYCLSNTSLPLFSAPIGKESDPCSQ